MQTDIQLDIDKTENSLHFRATGIISGEAAAAMDIDPIEVIHVCALKQTNGRQPFFSLYYLRTDTQVT